MELLGAGVGWTVLWLGLSPLKTLGESAFRPQTRRSPPLACIFPFPCRFVRGSM